MTTDKSDDLTDADKEFISVINAAATLAERCNELRDKEFWVGRDPLGQAIRILMTELWDRSFSQSEIRAAFTAALDAMNRYAAGQERR
jgi:hypothetical protein